MCICINVFHRLILMPKYSKLRNYRVNHEYKITTLEDGINFPSTLNNHKRISSWQSKHWEEHNRAPDENDLYRSSRHYSSLIHLAEPHSRPVVIIVFAHSVRTFHNLAKQNKFQAKTKFPKGNIVSLTEWIIDAPVFSPLPRGAWR